LRLFKHVLIIFHIVLINPLFRQQYLKDWKEINLITPAHCCTWGRSSHIQKLIKVLEKLQDESMDPKHIKMTDVSSLRR